jgi:hypothetical protein
MRCTSWTSSKAIRQKNAPCAKVLKGICWSWHLVIGKLRPELTIRSSRPCNIERAVCQVTVYDSTAFTQELPRLRGRIAS